MAVPRISVILVNLNGARFLPGCLGALARQTCKDFEVVLVDNGSRDESLALVEKDYPWVRVIPQAENLGFARGNNIGFQATSAPFLVTLNNDALPQPDWLEALLAGIEADRSVGMVASKILLGEEGRIIDSVGMLLYPDGMTRQRGRGQVDHGQYDEGGEVLFPSACAALYRREMLDRIGFFDEAFFSYCEDSDLGLRARLAGWNAVLAPKAVVRHLYSGTGGKYSGFKAFHVERNHWWVLVKNLPAHYWLGAPFYLIWRYMVLSFGLLSGRGSVARMAGEGNRWQLPLLALQAHLSALLGFRKMVKKRKQVWGNKQITRQDYARLLKQYPITATELMLED